MSATQQGIASSPTFKYAKIKVEGQLEYKYHRRSSFWIALANPESLSQPKESAISISPITKSQAWERESDIATVVQSLRFLLVYLMLFPTDKR